MKGKDVKEDLKRILEANADEAYRKGAENYFKEEVRFIGVRSGIVKRISAEYYRNLRHLTKSEILSVCSHLLSEDISEYSSIALNWAYRLRRCYDRDDFRIFKNWAEKYIHNWGTCDNFSTHVLGEFLMKHGEYVNEVVGLNTNPYWPVRRVAAVGLIFPVRRGKYLREAFRVSRLLMNDEHYLVQKGYGWLLKDASLKFPDEVYSFIMKNKDRMTRTALRYSLERYDMGRRKKAME